jgi:hypothetical protein
MINIEEKNTRPQCVNIIIARKIIHMWHVALHIVKKKGTQSLLRKPEQ